LPTEALEQDPQQIIAIMDYRAAYRAKEEFNTNAAKMPESLGRLWTEINEELRIRGHLQDG